MLRAPQHDSSFLHRWNTNRLLALAAMAIVELGVIPITGCGSSSDDQSIEDPADLGVATREPYSGSGAPSHFGSDAIDPSVYAPTGIPNYERITDETSTITPMLQPAAVDEIGIVGEAKPNPARQPEQPASATRESERQLRSDLTPDQLVDFLSETDRYMQAIYEQRAGIRDQQTAFREMNQTAQLKLKAARQLKTHSDADASKRIEGARGEIQALSHLASQGSLNAATELKQLAKESLQSNDKRLVEDSQSVLIGFAIEDLQRGKPDAAERIVELLKTIDSADADKNVAILMVMGQARELLAKYGHDQEAILVRQRIIDNYANSPDPQIARLAAQVAGNVRFDTIDKLRSQLLEGDAVAKNEWLESVDTLIRESADLVTVQYLAGAALEFEGAGLSDFANATYDTMSQRFDDKTQATGREVQLAIQAFETRQNAIGRLYEPKLGSVDGQPISVLDYRGKVMLMPFWSSGFPESLQVLPLLEKLREEFESDVEIVGINLDPNGPRLEKFLAATKLNFRSFHAVSPPDGGNPIAAQFGMVSMPFVLILDQESRVAGIDFTGRSLRPTIERLIKKSTGSQ